MNTLQSHDEDGLNRMLISPRLLRATLSVGMLFFVSALGLLLSEAARAQARPSPEQTATDAPGVAVVESFTSEGCSSCPPADRLLRSLVESARRHDRPIYALSFHVDYWNGLGWKDPYSKAAYSQRQRTYAEALGVDTYTPQVIVNGRSVFVGSRATILREALEEALWKPARTHLRLRAAEKEEKSIDVHYRLSGGVPEMATVQLAIVERGLSQQVPRGENAGRTLRHANVVRSFTTGPARRDDRVQLALPPDVDRSSASVIAYVQTADRTVVGAARIDLSAPSNPAQRR